MINILVNLLMEKGRYIQGNDCRGEHRGEELAISDETYSLFT